MSQALCRDSLYGFLVYGALGFWYSPCRALLCIWNYHVFLCEKAGTIFAVPVAEMKYSCWEHITRTLCASFCSRHSGLLMCVHCDTVRLTFSAWECTPLLAATHCLGSQSLSCEPVHASRMCVSGEAAFSHWVIHSWLNDCPAREKAVTVPLPECKMVFSLLLASVTVPEVFMCIHK